MVDLARRVVQLSRWVNLSTWRLKMIIHYQMGGQRKVDLKREGSLKRG